ncbi:hypothetical protein JB92DRAFT_2942674, partial [Gautieria morchelliformis]
MRRFHCFEKHSSCSRHRILCDPPPSTSSQLLYGHDLRRPVDTKTWLRRFRCIENHSSCSRQRILADPPPSTTSRLLYGQGLRRPVDRMTWTNRFHFIMESFTTPEPEPGPHKTPAHMHKLRLEPRHTSQTHIRVAKYPHL